jgi:NAD(P)-dependent dehydrogenase (short-subunit alcohol dehydrogenase family)
VSHQPRTAAKSAAPALAGKVALVTGAATGIGKAIAAALAAAGANLVINHNHTPDPARKVAAGIEAAGGTAVAVATDVTSRPDSQAQARRTRKSATGTAARPTRSAGQKVKGIPSAGRK